MSTDLDPKPTFARHRCGDHIHNDPEALEAHMEHCPADLADQLTEALEQLDKVTKSCIWLGEELERVKGIAQAGTGTAPVVVTEAVADWPFEEDEAEDAAQDDAATEQADAVGDALAAFADATTELTPAEDDLDARIANITGTVGPVA